MQKWLITQSKLIKQCTRTVFQDFVDIRENYIRSEIRSSLAFEEMNYRYDAIVQAQPRTLDWLFDLKSDAQESGDSFAQWLSGKDTEFKNLYWIRGKPGSGKSTLMRNLRDDLRTRTTVKGWFGDRKLALVSCFFWASGTPLQKSLRGLLQTMLYQLLCVEDNFEPAVCHPRWILFEYGAQQQIGWSADELEDAIARFVHLYSDQLRILFIVDGLDEFEGDDNERQKVCMLLQNLAISTNVKVCVSSRPWNVYKDAFENFPTLCLEQLNREDILHFAEDKFEENGYFKAWRRIEPYQAQDLISEIERKAEGVFLWVRLVVQSLLDGIKNGDDAHELRHRLQDIPSDLENLFNQMLSRIDEHNRESASCIFDLAVRGEHFVMLYYFVHSPGTSSEFFDPFQSTQEIIHRWQEGEIRRINQRSMGLLQFNEQDDHDWHYQARTVCFIHRTARDFMASPWMLDKMAVWRTQLWNPYVALIQSRVRFLQVFNTLSNFLGSLERGSCKLIDQSILDAESNSHEPLVIDAMIAAEPESDKILMVLMLNLRSDGRDDNLAIMETLQLAMRERCMSYSLARLNRAKRGEQRELFITYLLCVAVDFKNSGNHKYDWQATTFMSVLKRLFELGANPNEVRYGKTAWAILIRDIDFVIRKSGEAASQVIKLFIEAGAKDWIELKNGSRLRTCNSAEKIRDYFSGQHAAELLQMIEGQPGFDPPLRQEKKKNRRSFISRFKSLK